jgi:predicted enzyme related to lactoylglutathione lyase
MSKKGRVTGIGGVFFKTTDPDQTKEWYKTNLGLNTDAYGTTFEWRDKTNPEKKGHTQWSPFNADTNYFEPSPKEFMINYRVENIEALVEQLKLNNVTILDELETFDYGKFIHILDGDNNKIELWEPNDIEYDKIIDGSTS